MSPRNHLIAALQADLIGPFDPKASESELLPLKPSRWYLTGFLVPEANREPPAEDKDPQDGEQVAAGNDEAKDDGAEEGTVQKQPLLFPASMGLSVFVEEDTKSIVARLRWAEYTKPDAVDEQGRTKRGKQWQRVARGPATVEVPLDAALLEKGLVVPETSGVRLEGKLERVDARAGGGRAMLALSLFVVNGRSVADPKDVEEHTMFQVALELECARGFVARPNVVGDSDRAHLDERVADLQYRNQCEYAVGHGVSWVVPEAGKRDGNVHVVATSWLPTSEVKLVRTASCDSVETRMHVLAELATGDDVAKALSGIVEAYRTWIGKQRATATGTALRNEVRDRLMDDAERACKRMLAGIELLRTHDDVRHAFCLANRAMADARGQGGDSDPRWRMFQLAFVLLNLRSIAEPEHDDRKIVELIFFPTGGGKTEAYLGVIAITLLLRRMRGHSRKDAGLGVAVILRYTLRLLTLDQLGRAATLICALELLRRKQPEQLGDVRFSIGLWVGKSASANTLSEVTQKIREFKNNRGGNPFPLTQCPWCKQEVLRDGMTMEPAKKPEQVRVACMSPTCAFSGRASGGDGLPVLFVDEQIYTELPCFVIATVDKFAMLPWRGETGKLFGRVTGRNGRRFVGPIGTKKSAEVALPEGNLPPELIVQDELHLISGPLGTMVGLYETAIELLCTRMAGDRQIPPKIIASTATVRRADRQVQALFGRSEMQQFPPPGIDAFETFFAEVETNKPGRLYVGVAASGRSMKAILLRTYAALLGAARRTYDPKGEPTQDADVYTTLAGYFNSLRELGGMRRLVEDDVRTRCRQAEDRRPTNAGGRHPWVSNLDVDEPVELTSRERTDRIATTKQRLERRFTEDGHVDVLLASNMISVGVDIDRLGLMVVAGQPKTTSEYIQATSRVGRKTPGIVFTCFNLHKPRDRSHYERFGTYHQSFYRAVEATSLTPFSTRALERGLAALMVTLVRLNIPAMTPAKAVADIASVRALANALGEFVAQRAANQPDVDSRAEAESLRRRIAALLDTWTELVPIDSDRIYSRFDTKQSGKALLRGTPTNEEEQRNMTDLDRTFIAPTSMRDVEGTVHLWVERYALGGKRR